MKSELQQLIIEMIEDARGLAIEHAPRLIQELILWAQIEAALAILAFTAMLTLTLLIARRGFKINKDPNRRSFHHSDAEPFFIVATVLGIVTSIFFVVAVVHTTIAIKATVAPYAFLLQQIR